MEDDILEQQPDQFDTTRPIIEPPAPDAIEPVPPVAMPPAEPLPPTVTMSRGFVPLSGRVKGCEK